MGEVNIPGEIGLCVKGGLAVDSHNQVGGKWQNNKWQVNVSNGKIGRVVDVSTDGAMVM